MDTEKILKSLLKVGLKAAVPVIGPVLASTLEEGGSLFLDHQSAKKAKDLEGRLLKQMQTQVPGWLLSGELEAEELMPIATTAEVILARVCARLRKAIRTFLLTRKMAEIPVSKAFLRYRPQDTNHNNFSQKRPRLMPLLPDYAASHAQMELP